MDVAFTAVGMEPANFHKFRSCRYPLPLRT